MKRLFAIVLFIMTAFAHAEITKVQDLEGCDLYFSTQLWHAVSVPDSKDESIKLYMDMMSNTESESYKKWYEGLPRLEEIKILKAEDLKEDTLKLLDISGVFYLIDSYWGGKAGGGSTEWLVWKDGENIYCYTVVYNRTRGISLYKED